MRTDNRIRCLPVGRVSGQRLRDKDIERGAANVTLLERRNQCVVIDRRSAPDVHDPRMFGQHLQSLRVQHILGVFRARQDHDQRIRGAQQLRQFVLGVDLDALTHTGVSGHALDVGAQGRQPGRQGLCDVAEPPDQDIGVLQRREFARGPVRLRSAQVAGPFALELEVAHLEEAARRVQKQSQSVLGDGVVVQAGARADGHFRSVEARAENVIRSCGEGLDPVEVLETFGFLFELRDRVAPCYQDLGVGVLVGNVAFDVVWDKGHVEAFQALGVEGDGRWIEELHFELS